jgi:glycosyltransferase involved in cell wall biosynthesis
VRCQRRGALGLGHQIFNTSQSGAKVLGQIAHDNEQTSSKPNGSGVGVRKVFFRPEAISDQCGSPMTRVLLLHGGQIPHYRVPVYNHLSQYLADRSFALTVTSEQIQPGNTTPVQFDFVPMHLSAGSIARLVWRGKFDVVIMFVDMRHLYLFPVYLIVKGLLRRKMVWWGQGRDLAHPAAVLKNAAYKTEHALCDSIILYAEHLKKYVARRFHPKIFVANNTLALTYPGLPPGSKDKVLSKFNIRTPKNIICMGRFQKRKRVDRLVAAIQQMNRSDIGLILVGPDAEGVLENVDGPNIYKLGPIYDDQRFDLLSASDVYCLPGAVGLSIVDAFHCGLPFVTEEGDESAEIAYLKHGENGFIVPRSDVGELSRSLLLLLDNDCLRKRFSKAARQEAAVNASIDRLCEGFALALRYATLTVAH